MDRRKGPDLMGKWLKISNLILWSLIFVFVFITDLAKPVKMTLFDHIFLIERSLFWDVKLLLIALIISCILCVIAFVTLFVNLHLHKRKNDQIHKSIFFSMILSILSIIYLTIRLYL